VAVASTKAFTSQATVLTQIAIWFAQNRGEHGVEQYTREALVTSLNGLSLNMQSCITSTRTVCKQIAQFLFDKNHQKLFILGKGNCHPIALEGALKIKEIAYIQAEGYAGGALKHGPFALIEEGTPIIMVIMNDGEKKRMQTACAEVHARGAHVIVVTDDEEVAKDKHVHLAVRVPHCGIMSALVATIPFQSIAYELSLLRGINPDQPRNLAKAVTVD
jgi:glucosamine--fructose-6-phosphate aminotransferase (isomerizing)